MAVNTLEGISSLGPLASLAKKIGIDEKNIPTRGSALKLGSIVASVASAVAGVALVALALLATPTIALPIIAVVGSVSAVVATICLIASFALNSSSSPKKPSVQQPQGDHAVSQVTHNFRQKEGTSSENLTDLRKHYQEWNKAITAELNTCKEQIKAQIKEIKVKEKETSKALRTLRDKEVALGEATSYIVRLEADIERLEKEIKLFRGICELEAQVPTDEAIPTPSATSEEEKQELQAQLDAKHALMKVFQQEKEAIEKELDKGKVLLEQKELELSAITKENRASEERVKELQESLQKMTENVERKEEDLAKLSEEVEKKNALIEEMERELGARAQAYKEQSEAYKEQGEEINKYRNLKVGGDRLHELNKILLARIKEREEELERAQADKAALEQQIQELEKRIKGALEEEENLIYLPDSVSLDNNKSTIS